ncbi:hypothetical protein DRO54_03105 [Candidatus Bathyarchaeota archaeon]|nr:MAG: hypothetical protein DRO54_03105 [Candidatus Bathyarchaeota archaeon]
MIDEEIYSFALKNALTEIGNICSDVKLSFIFNQDGKVLAVDARSTDYNVERMISNFEEVFEKSHVVGGVNSITVDAKKGKIIVSNIGEKVYLATVTNRNVDMKYLETVSRVLIPTVLKLLEKMAPAPLKKPSIKEKTVSVEEETTEKEEEEKESPEIFSSNEEIETETPQIPTNQLIVDTFGGLLVRQDTVKIDNEILSQWSEVLDRKDINMVEIETFEGKTAQCKVKPIKDSKLSGKGIIKIPEKLCDLLDIKKGELVRVRPAISKED